MFFTDTLNTYGKITLEEMDSVKLMDRTDTKYCFREDQLAEILNAVQPSYKALEINEKRLATYHTLYYDTENLDLYNRHHNGLLNRYKIRHRTYVDSNLGFLEVKFKNNKGRTIKTRIKKREVPELFADETENFLRKELPFNPDTLQPRVWVNYKRITLVSRNSPERLTIDTGLEFIKKDGIVKMENLVIAEVKQDKKQLSEFIRLMKQHHIREGGISKYCLAIINMEENIKKNSFKPKLLTLKKILNYVPAAGSC
jgi:hypothetical protein